jgi:hypothetical protein
VLSRLSAAPFGEYLLQNAKLVIAVQIMMIFLCNNFENDVLRSLKRLPIVFLAS